MSKRSRRRFPPAAAPTMVLITPPRHHPPRPSTIGSSDCDVALALCPNWPRSCTHQAFHTSNSIVRCAGPSMARTRRSQGGTAMSQSVVGPGHPLRHHCALAGLRQTRSCRDWQQLFRRHLRRPVAHLQPPDGQHQPQLRSRHAPGRPQPLHRALLAGQAGCQRRTRAGTARETPHRHSA